VAVMADPMKPKLKPPGWKLLKLKCCVLLSNLAFKFNLRCYIQGSGSLEMIQIIQKCGGSLKDSFLDEAGVFRV